MMKLYQSSTHRAPSGPTSAMMGENHSSSLARKFFSLVALKSAPEPSKRNWPMRWPVGSVTNETRFQ